MDSERRMRVKIGGKSRFFATDLLVYHEPVGWGLGVAAAATKDVESWRGESRITILFSVSRMSVDAFILSRYSGSVHLPL